MQEYSMFATSNPCHYELVSILDKYKILKCDTPKNSAINVMVHKSINCHYATKNTHCNASKLK